jgi:hypothetical protein
MCNLPRNSLPQFNRDIAHAEIRRQSERERTLFSECIVSVTYLPDTRRDVGRVWHAAVSAGRMVVSPRTRSAVVGLWRRGIGAGNVEEEGVEVYLSFCDAVGLVGEYVRQVEIRVCCGQSDQGEESEGSHVCVWGHVSYF